MLVRPAMGGFGCRARLGDIICLTRARCLSPAGPGARSVKSERVYLDWNATAPLRPEAREAMVAAMDVLGNPSSIHAEGRAAKALVERARARVAAAVDCLPGEVVFTSGATEAASLLGKQPRARGVFVQQTAHDALWVHRRPRAKGAGCTLAMGLANGETGVVTPPPEKRDGQWPIDSSTCADLLLVDITQAVGRIPFSFTQSGVDFAILSSHKLGGPKGVGALIVRGGHDIPALSLGGGQEMNRRSGTENVAGVVGFGAAAEAAMHDLADESWNRIAELRNILENTIEAEARQIIFVGRKRPRLPNTSCLVTAGWKGETQVMQLDLAGFAVSAGSACSSGKISASRVLRAMGYDDLTAASAIRVSLCLGTTEEDVLRFAEVWLARYRKFRARAA